MVRRTDSNWLAALHLLFTLLVKERCHRAGGPNSERWRAPFTRRIPARADGRRLHSPSHSICVRRGEVGWANPLKWMQRCWGSCRGGSKTIGTSAAEVAGREPSLSVQFTDSTARSSSPCSFTSLGKRCSSSWWPNSESLPASPSQSSLPLGSCEVGGPNPPK